MGRWAVVLGALVWLPATGCGGAAVKPAAGGGHVAEMTEGSVLDFTLPTLEGAPKALADYRGQVLLIVNVASQCGYTPQYAPLQALYEKYKAQGFRVLGFPANNFGAQEPGTDPEIRQFCTSRYGVTFDLFSKISVKGPDIHPLYRWLTTASPFPGEITWNFNKFLVDRRGNVVARYPSKVEPLAPELVSKVEALLAER